MNNTSPWRTLSLILLFFLSGGSALVFELLWVRLLGPYLGSSPATVAIVIGLFMGGLAAGGLLASRVRGDGLRAYGVAEILIAIWGMATPGVLAVLSPVFDAAFGLEETAPAACRLLQFLATAGLILPPTVLMGLSFPILARSARKSAAALYASNTAGAVGGSITGGLLLLPTVGLDATRYAASAVSLAVGLAAIALSARGQASACPPEASQLPRAGRSRAGQPDSYPRLWLPGLIGLWGAATLGYEIACERALAMSLGSSIYSLTLVVATFIAGLALGGAVFARWAPRDPWFGLAGASLGAGVACILVVPLLGNMPIWIVPFITCFGRFPYLVLMAAECLVIAALLLPPAFLMGAGMPLACRLVRDPARFGPLYSASTLGSIGGSLTTGLLLIPLLGMRDSLLLWSAMFLIVAGLAASRIESAGRRHACAIAVVPALVALLMVPPWRGEILATGPFLYAGIYRDAARKTGLSVSRVMTHFDKLLYYQEGAAATVSVREDQYGNRSLAVNGKVDASSGLDMETQIFIGQLSMLFADESPEVLVVGLGSGVTVGSIATHPARSIECLELLPEVVEASHFFDHVNGRPLEDSRVRLLLRDARTHMRVSKRRYDVICSEPSNPWVAGMASLFTVEHFKACRERLKDKGIICQWVQAYSLSPDDFRSVVRTFQTQFPRASLWEAMKGGDYLLVARKDGGPLNFDRTSELLEREEIRTDLARAGIKRGEDLAKRFVMGPEALTRLADGATINTDDLPVLEFSAPLSLHKDTGSQLLALFEPLREAPDSALRVSSAPMARKLATSFASRQLADAGWSLASVGELEGAQRLFEGALDMDPHDEDARKGLKELLLERSRKARALGKLELGKEMMERYLELDPEDVDVANDLGVIYRKMGNSARARGLFRSVLKRDADHGAALRNLALEDYESGDHAAAVEKYEQVVRLNPSDALAMNNLGICLMKLERYPEALSRWRAALKLDPGLTSAKESIRIIEFLGYK